MNQKMYIEKDHKISSQYDRFNIENGDQGVGEIRPEIHTKSMSIYSIYIFPEIEGQGIAHIEIQRLDDRNKLYKFK